MVQARGKPQPLGMGCFMVVVVVVMDGGYGWWLWRVVMTGGYRWFWMDGYGWCLVIDGGYGWWLSMVCNGYNLSKDG